MGLIVLSGSVAVQFHLSDKAQHHKTIPQLVVAVFSITMSPCSFLAQRILAYGRDFTSERWFMIAFKTPARGKYYIQLCEELRLVVVAWHITFQGQHTIYMQVDPSSCSILQLLAIPLEGR